MDEDFGLIHIADKLTPWSMSKRIQDIKKLSRRLESLHSCEFHDFILYTFSIFTIEMETLQGVHEQLFDRNKQTFNPTGTKSLLDANTFAEEGNQIKVYDYYTANGSTTSSIYIDDKVKSEGPSQATWPFVAQRYNWTADGSHKFFGWMAEDVNMTSAADAAANTPEEFFGGSFSFNTATQALTVPAKALNQTTHSLTSCIQTYMSVTSIPIRTMSRL